MHRIVFVFAATLGFGSVGMPAQWMQIPQLRDAPFEATNTLVITDNKGTHSTAGKVARNAAGSTHVELWTIGTHELSQVLIFDVPGKRFITLSPGKKVYTLQELPELNAHALAPNALAEPIAESTASRSSHSETGRVANDVSTLGQKDIEGVRTIGRVETRRGTDPSGATVDLNTERWWSPELEIDLLSKTINRAKGVEQIGSLSDIKRGEPSATLFEIPAGYTRDPQNASQAEKSAVSAGQ